MARRGVAAIVGVAVLALAAYAVHRLVVADDVPEAGVARPVEDMLGRWPRSQFYMEPDRFLPLTDPRTLPASEVRFLSNDDEVFGVLIQDEARAYPIPMIAYHHVVNDVIRGIPVAITY